MACFRGMSILSTAILFFACAYATQVPLPYTSANFDNSVETKKAQDAEGAASGNFLQHYDSGSSNYKVPSSFDGFLIPTSMIAHEEESTDLGMLSTVYSLMQPIMTMSASILPKVGVALASVGALLAVGLGLALFFCAHTSVCHMTLMGFDMSRESMRTYITNDRVAEVARFLQTAIKKYQDMNKKEQFESNIVK